MSYILESCIISQSGALIWHHSVDDDAVTYDCKMSHRKYSLHNNYHHKLADWFSPTAAKARGWLWEGGVPVPSRLGNVV